MLWFIVVALAVIAGLVLKIIKQRRQIKAQDASLQELFDQLQSEKDLTSYYINKMVFVTVQDSYTGWVAQFSRHAQAKDDIELPMPLHASNFDDLSCQLTRLIRGSGFKFELFVEDGLYRRMTNTHQDQVNLVTIH